MSQTLTKKILLINGPNLNLLGSREPDLYGRYSLKELEQALIEKAQTLGMALSCLQSNNEGALIDAIHQAQMNHCNCIIINPGAYTHTSIGLRDAFLGTQLPFIEVHISNIYAREPFRHHSYLSDIAKGIVIGHGLFGYELALLRAHHLIETEHNTHPTSLV